MSDTFVSRVGRLFAGVLVVGAMLTGVAGAGAPVAGSLDPSFDEDGIRVDDFGSDEVVLGIAVQPDGRIVVTGSCGGLVLVARYTESGQPDPTFGTAGRVCLGAGGGGGGQEVFVRDDGKIVVAAWQAGDFAVLRLDASGTPDGTFDGDGVAVFDLGAREVLEDAALAPDGDIVLAGWSERPGCPVGPPTFIDYALARVTPAGTLDPSFDDDGKLVIPNGAVARARAVLVQPDGAIVVGGDTASCSRVVIDHSLFRLTAEGDPDPSFSYASPFFEVGGDSIVDLARQDDGRLVAVIDTFVGPATSPERDDAFMVVRVLPGGAPDPGFDGDGVATVLFGAGGSARPRAVAIQPDGKIVVAGSFDNDFALARLLPNGSPDPTFGDGGRVVTTVGQFDALFALALPGDGTAIVGGESDNDVALARYLLGDGGPPPSGPECLGRTATIVGTAGDDVLTGTPGPDVIAGLGGDDTIDGLAGEDRICGGDGDDELVGGDGNDRISGEAGRDRVFGGAGGDRLQGGDGNDLLRGDAGDDLLLGDAGNDRLRGGRGQDVVRGGEGSDLVDGGAGVDVLEGGPEDDPPADTDHCESDGGTDTTSGCETIV